MIVIKILSTFIFVLFLMINKESKTIKKEEKNINNQYQEDLIKIIEIIENYNKSKD